MLQLALTVRRRCIINADMDGGDTDVDLLGVALSGDGKKREVAGSIELRVGLVPKNIVLRPVNSCSSA